MLLPAGLNATALPVAPGNVLGSLNFVPNPEELHEYAVTLGLVSCATAITLPDGLNATPPALFVGRVLGFVYLIPKPVPLQRYAVMNGLVLCATAREYGAGLGAAAPPRLARTPCKLPLIVR
jgi:hypothetical protein